MASSHEEQQYRLTDWSTVYGPGGADRITSWQTAKQRTESLLHFNPPCECAHCGESWRPIPGPVTSEEDDPNDLHPQSKLRASAYAHSSTKPFMSYRRVLTLQEASDELAQYTTTIHAETKYLRETVQHHGLNSVTMEEKARQWSKGAIGEADASGGTQKVDAMRYEAQEWVATDRSHTAWAWETGIVEVDFCPMSVHLKGPDYGKLALVDLNNEHVWASAGFPRASMILRAQACLLQLLGNVVRELLKGLNDPTGQDRWLQFVSSPYEYSDAYDTFPLFAGHLLASPAAQDPQRILRIAKGCFEPMEDLLWTLQTEPACFDQWLLRPGQNAGRRAQVYGYQPLSSTFDQSLREIITLAGRIARWREIHDLCEKFSMRMEQCTPAAKPDCSKLDNLARMLRELDDLVSRQLLERLTSAAVYLGHETGQATPVNGTASGMIGGVLQIKKPSRPQLYPEPTVAVIGQDTALGYALQYVFMLIAQPGGVRARRLDIDIGQVLALLNYYINPRPTDPNSGAQRRGVSYLVGDILMEVLALHHIMVSLQSGSRGIIPDDAMLTSDVANASNVTMSFRFPAAEEKALAHRLKAFDALPATEGKQDWGWLTKRDARLAALQAFWNTLEAAFRRSSDQQNSGIIRVRVLLANHRHPNSVARLEQDRQVIVERLRKEEQERLGIPGIQTQWGENTPGDSRSRSQTAPKEKSKARASPKRKQVVDVSRVSDALTKLATDEQAPAAVIEVDRENLLILQRLYSSGSVTRRPGAWQSFVKAMVDAGFSMKHKGGSMVEFESGTASITVHKPHAGAAGSKLDMYALMEIGRRMTRNFAWTRETFTERSKPA